MEENKVKTKAIDVVCCSTGLQAPVRTYDNLVRTKI